MAEGQRSKGSSLQNRYFVIEPDQIVADDLAHAIRVHDPAAEVVVFRSPEAALDALAIGPPRAVLLHHEPRGFSQTPAGIALQTLDVPYAFRGMMSEAEAEGAHVLASPFNENTVAELLRRLLHEG
jgi:hypothetical protein